MYPTNTHHSTPLPTLLDAPDRVKQFFVNNWKNSNEVKDLEAVNTNEVKINSQIN